jgi:pre-rRNA-processing protein TSR3
VNELNTVEALSAALYLLGEPERAARLLDGFRGGPVFLELNRERLDQYRTAIDGVQVRAIERKLFGD